MSTVERTIDLAKDQSSEIMQLRALNAELLAACKEAKAYVSSKDRYMGITSMTARGLGNAIAKAEQEAAVV